MRYAAGPPTRWSVHLRSGEVVEVWADGFDRDGNHFTFSALFDLDDGETLPSDALVVGETPSNPARFILAVARFSKAAVLDGAGDEPAIYSP